MHSIQWLLKYLFYQYLSIPLKIMSGFFLQCFEIYIDESCLRSLTHIPSNQLNSFSSSENPLCRVDWLKWKLNFIQHSLLIVFHTSNKLKLTRKYIHIGTDKHYSIFSFINLNQNNAYHFHTREFLFTCGQKPGSISWRTHRNCGHDTRNIFRLPEKKIVECHKSKCLPCPWSMWLFDLCSTPLLKCQ